MQLYAKDPCGTIHAAHHAARRTDYFCLECSGPLRRRGGMHRQAHFYHLNPTQECRQSGKTIEHLQVQIYLHELTGAALEVPFEPIGRIADLYWEEQKIIFEVQCSPISAAEVAARNRDYKSLGLYPIWILHGRRFNRLRLTAAELFLRSSPHYFTNIDREGYGFIYDQGSVIARGFRRGKQEPILVDPSKPSFDRSPPPPAPRWLNLRQKEWNIGFYGDLLNPPKTDPTELQRYLSEAAAIESLFYNRLNKPQPLLKRCGSWIVHCWKTTFGMLLDSTSG